MTNSAMNSLRFIILNVNGLGDHVKRRMIFKFLHKFKNAIICLQETYLQAANGEWQPAGD